MAMVRRNWTEDEVTLALALYLRTPRSRINAKHPDIIELAAALGRTPSAVSMKMHNLAAHDKVLTDRQLLSLSHGSHIDGLIWERYMGADRTKPLTGLLEAVETLLTSGEYNAPSFIDANTLLINETSTLKTESLAIVKQRRNQAYFREAVMTMYDRKCLVTGLHSDPLIEVAHIVPWAENEALRLVTANALTLNPLIHRAYDANLIGIDPDMVIHVDEELILASEGDLRTLFLNVDGHQLALPEHARPAADYLDAHYQGFLKHEHHPMRLSKLTDI